LQTIWNGNDIQLKWFSFALACRIAFAGTLSILGTSSILTPRRKIHEYQHYCSYLQVFWGILLQTILAILACAIATVPYTRFCICPLDYDYVLYIVTFAIFVIF
jgi:hypothetical protein